MARDPVVKEIDGEQYTFCQLAPKASLRLLVRLFKILGAPAGAAMDGAGLDLKSIKDADIDMAGVTVALCDRLDENEVEAVIDMLLSQTIHKGHGEVSKAFDAIFAGRLPHLFKVVGAALQVEYADFFGEGSDVVAMFKKVLATTQE